LKLEACSRLPVFARAVFEAYWGDLEDISQDAVLERIASLVGLDPTTFFGRINAPEYKQRLRVNTDELIARGGFGSPTMFVDTDDMYFGNDRLPLVREALLQASG
jgi:2-hydroxychromene-2-carboxylate isomerase